MLKALSIERLESEEGEASITEEIGKPSARISSIV